MREVNIFIHVLYGNILIVKNPLYENDNEII
jgi:hypothetical protein